MAANRKLALLTSGGDAPGMNAAIRSVVRIGTSHGLDLVGIRRGYQGLLNGEFETMGPRDVSNIIHRGGTILKTSRCEEFKTPAGVQSAREILERHGIDGLILIGGDGTFRGGEALGQVWRGQIIGLPGTIDNDLYGSDFTIGYDTALNTATEAIDKIRDTADSHERFFLVEVMGRHDGSIALGVGIATGAEEILLPDQPVKIGAICERLCNGRRSGKTSSIIVLAEGNDVGGAFKLAEQLKALSKNEYRVVILGHLQRGGSPTAADRILASRLGAYAVDVFLEGGTGVMVGEVSGQLRTTPFSKAFGCRKPLDEFLLRKHAELSR